jgi:hypothetical protein
LRLAESALQLQATLKLSLRACLFVINTLQRIQRQRVTWLLLIRSALPAKPFGMAPAYLSTPVPIRSSCLSNHTEGGAPSASDYTAAWETKIHVAFYDTRARPRLDDIRLAAAVFNTSSVLFHVLLAHPRPVPGMRVTDISTLPPLASCLHRNLKRLGHGAGPQYLMKPLLHWALPRQVCGGSRVRGGQGGGEAAARSARRTTSSAARCRHLSSSYSALVAVTLTLTLTLLYPDCVTLTPSPNPAPNP